MGTPVWYITTPIYYPSGDLHVGNAYTTVVADALARYHRLQGQPVLFVTGTDEHGQKIAKSAEAAGVSPLHYVNEIVARIQDPLWSRLHISYDDFIRTTEPRHYRVVQSIFSQLQEQGDIYKGVYEGWYCLPDESFWTESKLVDKNCPDCGRPVEKVQQESYFFRMNRYQDAMIEYIETHPDFIQPISRRNEMLAFLRSGLEDLSISRTDFTWGIPVPGDPDHVIYVWFDALTNYLTAAGYLSDPERFARTWPADVHLVGKEIVRFHSIIWPIMLMALKLPLPRIIFGHGWVLLGDTKMSKSRGNVVDPLVLIDRYGLDAVRYYLLKEVPFGADGSYTEDALILRTNVDLANDLGNLLSRSTAMIERFNGGVVPPLHEASDSGLLAHEVARVYQVVRDSMDRLEVSVALTAIATLVRAANKYIEDQQPWALARQPELREQLENVLYNLAEVCRVLSVLLTPFLIEAPKAMRQQLGIDAPVERYEEAIFGGFPVGIRVRRGDPLFPRIETPAPMKASETPVAEPNWISIEDFQKVDLRVGTVKHAEIVEGADRLLKLTVFDGERERIIVSGIRQHYEPEALEGHQVVLVANLKPVMLRGIRSEGMLLAGSVPGTLSVVAPSTHLPEGARVK